MQDKAINILNTLERAKIKSAYLKHYLQLRDEGRINERSDWGRAHIYAVIYFVARHYSKYVSDLILSRDEANSYYNENVFSDIREGAHWGATAVRAQRWSGRAEDHWVRSQEG